MNLDPSLILNTAAGLTVGTVLAAVAVALVGWAYKKFIRDRAFPTRIENLETLVRLLLRINIVQIKGQKATLEGLKGQVNGNVDRALADVTKIDDEMTEFLAATAVPQGAPK